VGLYAALPGAGLLDRAALAASRRQIPLPSPQQVRADFQRMVDFGPRLTGSPAHQSYIEWLEREFTAAGLDLLPCDVYETDRWLAESFALDLLDGPGSGPVKVGTYMPRSKETPSDGITAPLVYGGVAPALSLNAGEADPASITAAVERYPADLASWASGVAGTIAGGTQDSILLVDLPMPLPVTTGLFAPLTTYVHWPGHSEAEVLTGDYKRQWLAPGLSMPLEPFQGMGAKGVVFILDSSYEALKGAYIPFLQDFQPIPALYVDRDTGAALRGLSGARPQSRLTLTATRQMTPTSSVTAILPGESEETLIFNTHTDGQGFVEENGGVAFVQLARYFGSLPQAERPQRTLVFAAWPGHMVADLPQAPGWIAAHPDLVERAAAALTVEHLGCTDWADTLTGGYQPTGLPEFFGVWTTQGKMFEITRDAVIEDDLPRTALLRPPAQFGVGSAFQSAGVPQIGAIAGPEYLLTISDNGDMDKLDEELAARQIAWLAHMVKRLEPVSAEELRQGDPTLGVPVLGGPEEDTSHPEACGPRKRRR
jgi:hypothetical protein